MSVKLSSLLCMLVLCSLIVPAVLGAQIASDPNDRVYSYLSQWHTQGFIKKLPMVRPYPLAALINLLREVRAAGNATESEIAQEYLDFYGAGGTEITVAGNTGGGRQFRVRALFEYMTDFSDLYGVNAIEGIANGLLWDLVSYSGRFAFNLTVNPEADFFPGWTVIPDEAESGGGSFTIGDRQAAFMNYLNGSFSIGDEKLYVQAGVIRSAFGPVFDSSVVLSSSCYGAGHISFGCDFGWIGYSAAYLDLVAKYYEDPATGDTITVSEPVNKYVIIHSIDFYPADFISFGLIQTVVTGQLHFAYLIPFQNVVYNQVFYGDWDNSIMGVYIKGLLPFAVELDAVLYLDDFNFKRFSGQEGGVLFNLDSAQNKLAFQAAAKWSPGMESLREIGITYTAVTPYMYTHVSRVDNTYYLSYTHDETHIGSVLDPNSDELALRYTLSPAGLFDAELTGRYIRHGNASEDYAGGTGTIYDDGFENDADVGDRVPTFLGPSRFLTQDVLEHTLQFAIGVSKSLRIFESFSLEASVRYTFEYVWNKDLGEGDDVANNVLELAARIMY